MKKLLDYFHTEHVMTFLMGLNDSFSQRRTQLLLMELEPSIQRAFSLVAQEVKQRSSSNLVSTNPSAINVATLLVKGTSSTNSNTCSSGQSFKRKERPLCTHCGAQGHTVERCFKLHGFPPWYRTSRNIQTKSSSPVVASASHSLEQLSGLNNEQCQGLLSILQTHLAKNKNDTAAAAPHVAGICHDTTFNIDKNSWILDSGASIHICYSKELFTTLQPISGAYVSLPNCSRLTVEYIGTVQISPSLFLHNVMFVPSFRFNLFLISALTLQHSFTVNFLDNCCVIQDKSSLKKIG